MLAHRHSLSYVPVDCALRPSRSFADAVLHEWVVVGQPPVLGIDVAALYAIVDSLPDPQLGYSRKV